MNKNYFNFGVYLNKAPFLDLNSSISKYKTYINVHIKYLHLSVYIT